MTDITFDAGTVLLNEEDLTATGLLVPFHEEARSNVGRFKAQHGSFQIPADLSGSGLNVEHRREDVVGTLVAAEEQEHGIIGRFKFRDTPEGRQAFQDAKAGKRSHLSVEAAEVAIRNGIAVAGRIFGAALVERPAFPSATLLAAAVDTDAPDEPEPLDDEPAAETVTTAEVAEEEPTPEPAEQEEEPAVGAATVPNTLQATAPAKDKTALEVFELIDRARKGDRDETLLAALSDIKITGSGALPAAGVLQPAWLGELWSGRSYQRKYMPLIKNGVIRSIDEKGFLLDQGTALVAAWNGNKAELPTGTASTSLVSATLAKWGYAADIAREFFDLPGGSEVIDAFMRGVVNSYASVTDAWTLAQLVTAATANITAPDTYPTDYPESLGQLIQGISLISDEDLTPSFAIANGPAWTELLYTPKDQVPEFVTFSFATDGTGSADSGKVVVIKGDIGIDDTPAVLVGAREAAHVNEVAGSPIILEALNIANGGVDRSVVGYTQYMTELADGLVLVGTADTP